MTAGPLSDVCSACARRSWLVARLAGHLEHRRGDRDAIREVLGLDDRSLIDALGGLLAPAITAEYDGISAPALRAAWTAAGTHALCRHGERYPATLSDLPDAPAVLHVVGDPARLASLLGAPLVSIVGARKASDDGRESARLLGRGLSAAGVTIVSGMALGIDSAAHEGAMEAGANTIAVLACGPERAYPRSRAGLHRRLCGHAAVISELPPGTSPYRWAFPARNRMIAALAQLTIIVEAAERSGSLITADIAISLGRDVAAVPGSPVSWRCAGTNQLLREGAILVRDAVDALDGVAGAGPAGFDVTCRAAERQRSAPTIPAGLPGRLRDLLAAIDRGEDAVGRHADTPQAVRAVLGDLTELELLGLVQRRAGGRYTRVVA
ncbi:MAG TPA: DNA-processing protein DprA [Solirubrobacteraceae bacterium]|nr:DNA-processing protein DprA [Solirubrobacteraceae bacterium]